MADKYEKHEFRLTADCGKFLYALCETLKGCDRIYRDSIARDLRKKAEDLMCLIDRANRIRAGRQERTETQYQAVVLRDDIQTLLPVVCRLCMTGSKKQAVLEKMIEDIRQPLNNWYISDLKVRMQFLERRYRDRRKELLKAVKDYKKLEPYCKTHTGERYEAALGTAESACRVLKDECMRAKNELDEAQKKLLTQSFSKDYTLIGQVLDEIDTVEKKTAGQKKDSRGGTDDINNNGIHKSGAESSGKESRNDDKTKE